MKLFVVRHGETDWNAQHIAQGQTDIPLNAHGIEQAERLCETLKQRGLKFDAVYSSPLERVRRTAEIITGNQYNIVLDKHLNERNLGDLEGTSFPSWESLGVDLFDLKLNSTAFNVEPIRDFHNRVADFIADLRRKHAADDQILIVTSNGFIHRFRLITNQSSPTSEIGNGELVECDL